ncbi:MAG TPA: AAA family ATPase [Verrucomicrobiae bacterium]|nr:AAA family ATPase [Verrucomicrobiae bacterium]
MPASPTTVEMLNYGRLLWQSAQRSPSQPEDAQIKAEENRLISLLYADSSTTLRQILNFSNNGKTMDPVALRVLCIIAHLTLCTTRLGTTVAEIACGIAGDDPARVLEARRTISGLLLRRQLVLRDEHSDCVELGKSVLAFFAGGSEAPPIAPTESDLRRAWYRSDQVKARREAKAEAPLTAKQIALRIREQGVVGLEPQIRLLSSRMVLHTRRAIMIRTGKDSGSSSNQAILIAGPSGSGKTFLTEAACRVCGLPFSVFSSGDLTSEGYVGLSVEDTLRPLLVATKGDVQRARSGLVFLDEFDSKAASPSTNWRDITGTCVQKELLRIVEGAKIQIGGRRSGFDQTAPVLFDTTGVMWVFGGAFVGLDKLCAKQTAHGIGFGSPVGCSAQQRFLTDALIEYGLLPELCNRLTAILIFPEPSLSDLRQIAASVIGTFNAILGALGITIEITDDGVQLMSLVAKETKTFARGLKSVVSALIDDAVFEERQGVTRFGKSDVQRAIESAGLAAVG